MTRAIWFFEFKGYLTSLASKVQFGYATQDYAAQPADTGLAFGFYAGRLEQPGDFRQVMFSDGKTGGASQVSTGEIALVNASRLLDTLRFFAFDGRDAKLMFGRIGDDGALVAGSLRTVLEFQTERPLRQFNRVTFAIVDRQAEFARRSMQPTKFLGNGAANDVNAAPATPIFDGTVTGTIAGATDAGALAVLDTVDTTEIDANAVTSPSVAQTAAGISVSGSGFSEVQSLTITATGAPVLVNASLACQVQENGTGADVSMLWYVDRDGGAIIGSSSAPLGAGTSWDGKLVEVASAAAALDTPSSGSRTYKMYCRAESTSATTAVAFQRILTVTELKR